LTTTLLRILASTIMQLISFLLRLFMMLNILP